MWVLGSGIPDPEIVQQMPLTTEPSFQLFFHTLLSLECQIVVCICMWCVCVHVCMFASHVHVCMYAHAHVVCIESRGWP